MNSFKEIVFVITGIIAIIPWMTITILIFFPDLPNNYKIVMLIIKIICFIIATELQKEI